MRFDKLKIESIRKTGNLLPRADGRGIGKSSRISLKSGVPANDAGNIPEVLNRRLKCFFSSELH